MTHNSPHPTPDTRPSYGRAMKSASCLFIALSALCVSLTIAQAQDPLPSWNDTAPKKAIVAFVEKVTKEGSPDFVPPAERIATFDNDGTLWCEQPMYFQLLFALDRVKALAPQHPEWKNEGAVRLAAQGRREGRARRRRTRDARNRHGHARRHDHGRIRADRQATGSPPRSIRNSSGRTPSASISRCSNCSPTCAPTDSRPSSSPAAASSSCARGRKKSMASRPSRSSAAASRRSSRCATASPCSCGCRR